MKNELLDDIFQDKLRNELEEGEVVHWDGSPRVNKYSRFKSILYSFYFIMIFSFNFYLVKEKERSLHIIYLIIIPIIIWGFIATIFKQKKTRYIITNYRIIFQLPKGRKNIIHSLPLNQLEKISFEPDGENDGTIFLELKKPFKPSFKTRNLKYEHTRKVPTLEMVEEAEIVVGIINKAMEGKM